MFSCKAVVVSFAVILGSSATLAAQSSDQNFPSAVTSSEIGSAIRARDIGDARLTTHYWVFDGAQGDIFINVVTQNFTGDIDVYQVSDLKPLTKIVMFADAGMSETGRVIYMRQPGRLMLRIQGRTPNDDPASYKVKFAGSFVALAPQKEQKPPTVESREETGVTVNSVGTIIAARPKLLPEQVPVKKLPERAEAEAAATPTENPPAKDAGNQESLAVPEKTESNVDTVFRNKAAKVTVKKTPPETSNPPTRRTTASRTAKPRPEPAKDPLADVSLVITLKDGTRSEMPMTEVTRFVYDHGFLTVFMKDGSVKRVAVAEVASATVQ